MNPSEELYLDLMKQSLLGLLDEDPPVAVFPESTEPPVPATLVDRIKDKLNRLARSRDVSFAFDPRLRQVGRDWPSRALSMIGAEKMDNLHFCLETALADGVPGDLIETGVWRGGSAIFMRSILRAHGVTDRLVWVADSFQGFPPADAARFPADAAYDFQPVNDILAISIDQVRSNFERYGLLDDQVRFLQGFFEHTLPDAPIERLAVMRLDGDLYQSTIEALTHLYPKLSPGGFCIVDDYYAVAACAQAVSDYRCEHGIEEEVLEIDGTGVFWRRER